MKKLYRTSLLGMIAKGFPNKNLKCQFMSWQECIFNGMTD